MVDFFDILVYENNDNIIRRFVIIYYFDVVKYVMFIVFCKFVKF